MGPSAATRMGNPSRKSIKFNVLVRLLDCNRLIGWVSKSFIKQRTDSCQCVGAVMALALGCVRGVSRDFRKHQAPGVGILPCGLQDYLRRVIRRGLHA